MKLSEILKDWPKKVNHSWSGDNDIGCLCGCQSFNTALTSCDREIDREALAKALWDFVSEYHETDKRLPQMADEFISTMPKWLKPTERK